MARGSWRATQARRRKVRGNPQKTLRLYPRRGHSVCVRTLVVCLLLSALPVAAQTPKFSYSVTIRVQITATEFDSELRTELDRELQAIDGVELSGKPDYIVDVVALRTSGIVVAAVAVLTPIQKLLDGKMLRLPEPEGEFSMRQSSVMDGLLAQTAAAADLRGLAKTIAAEVYSNFLIADRDTKHAVWQFHTQNPELPCPAGYPAICKP